MSRKPQVRESNPRSTSLRRISSIALPLFLLLVMLISFSKIHGDDDVFWHLATGRWIIEHGSIPQTDVFGFVSYGTAWVPFEWGWDVSTYLLYSLTGNYFGIQALTALIWVGIFWLLMLVMKKSGVPLPILLITLILTLMVSFDRMTPRPHSISLLGLASILAIYLPWRLTTLGSNRRLYILPPMFLAWANFHPGVIAGLILLLLLLAVEVVLAVWKLHPNASRQTVLAFSMVVALCGLAMLVNPQGLQTYSYAYSHTQLSLLAEIKEWLPPFEAYDTFVLRCYKAALFIGSVSIIYAIQKKNPIPAVLYAAAALHSLRAVRFMADFAIVSATGTALGLTSLAMIKAPIRRVLNSTFTALVLTLGIGALIVGVISNTLFFRLNTYRPFGAGVDGNFFSFEMIEFLKRHNISGRAFHHLEIGGLLVWEKAESLNFIDSRNLSDSLAKEYYSIMDMRPGFEKKLNAYGIDHIVLHPMDLLDSPTSMQRTLIPWLTANGDKWKLVYWDDQSFVYLRNIPRFQAVIDSFSYQILHPYQFVFRKPVFDSLRNAAPIVYQNELARKLKEEPNGMIANLIARSSR